MCYAPTNDVDEVKKGQFYTILQLGKKEKKRELTVFILSWN